jgi:hypothetical protein
MLDSKFFEWIFAAVFIPYRLVPIPSRAGYRLANRKQSDFVSNNLSKFQFAGFALAALVIFFFYTGFEMLIALYFVVSGLTFFIISIDPKREHDLLTFCFGVGSCRLEGQFERFARIEERVRQNFIGGLLVAICILSAVAGDLRFEFLRRGEPVRLSQEAGTHESFKQVASSSKGVFLVAMGEQKFIPYDSIKRVSSSNQRCAWTRAHSNRILSIATWLELC